MVAATLLPAGPAQAIDDNCGEQNGHCIYWGQNYNGSHSNVVESVPNYPTSGSTPYTFRSSGSGQGQRIGNNNGSNRNYLQRCRIRLWYNPNYSGPNVVLAQYGDPGWQRRGSELGSLLNNIRSSDEEICYAD
ncbi:hypothetical protein DDE19_29015 [Micromonospora ureilytica]|uniref:Peptidase M23 n=2 Tax=Micromonospora ureilytica TaxID=709868 RepID=A0A3N9XXB7_9ACTN|nr:hypothetical protein DDE19_29015 [Micromonospora ureilytica]